MLARFALVLAVLTLTVTLTGCGFQPIYGGFQGHELQAQLAGIGVDPIPDRVGQVLRQNLLEQIGSDGRSPALRLRVTLDVKAEGSGFRADEASTRTNLTVTAKYQLLRVADDHVLVDETATVFAAYDVVESDFATLTARQDTERGLAEQAARQIETRLVTYFRDHGGEASNETPPKGH